TRRSSDLDRRPLPPAPQPDPRRRSALPAHRALLPPLGRRLPVRDSRIAGRVAPVAPHPLPRRGTPVQEPAATGRVLQVRLRRKRAGRPVRPAPPWEPPVNQWVQPVGQRA